MFTALIKQRAKRLYLRNKLNCFVRALESNSDQTTYLELSKEKEVYYFKNFLYRFEAILTDMAVCDNPSVILDIGTSPFTFFLQTYYSDSKLITVDYSDHLKRRCDLQGITHHKINMNSLGLPIKSNSIDLIIFTEVLEHIIAPPEDILNDIRRVLKKDGLLIISVPNIAYLSNRLRLFFGKNISDHPNKGRKFESIHGYGHIHEYTKEELTALCSTSGFRVVQVNTTSKLVA